MERRAVVRMQEVDTPMKPDFKVAKPRNGNGRPKFVLNNPQYVVRIAPPPAPPPSPPAWTPRPSAPPRRADGPPAAADFSDVSSAPSEPSADDGPVRDGKSQPRRLNQKAGKSGPVNDGEGGPKTKGVNKRGKGGRRGGMYEYNEATERAVRPSKKGGKKRQVVEVVEKGPIRVKLTGPITVGDLAAELEVGAAMVVKDLMKMGVMASMTQSIDVETAVTIAEGFGAEVTRPGEGDDDEVEDTLAASLPGVVEEEDDPADLQPRPPIVTVMGHVDHGKTSLLDALRSTDGRTIDVASGEAGGITQHIGAYALSLEAGNVTVLDTPGHAAFSQMRSRGANLTDVVILVVAADDGVKEQTVTSINAAKAAGVPIVVAINKIDKPGADPNVVKQGLLQHEVVLEEFGGDVLSAQVSAKTGEGLDTLLDQVLLQSSLLELKANPNRLATGIVLEARNAQGQGAVATALVQKGTLHVGDIVVAGSQWGRVRAILDERATRLNEAGPSAAVEVVGLGGLPNAGDVFTVTTDESAARETAAVRQQLERERKASQLFAARTTGGLDLFLNGKASDELPLKVLDFVVKADVQGSAQALSTAIAEVCHAPATHTARAFTLTPALRRPLRESSLIRREADYPSPRLLSPPTAPLLHPLSPFFSLLYSACVSQPGSSLRLTTSCRFARACCAMGRARSRPRT